MRPTRRWRYRMPLMTSNLRLAITTVLFALAAPGLSAPSLSQSSPDATRAVGEATGFGLQGDVPAALRRLAEIPDAQYAGGDAQFRACMRGRFERNAPPYLAGHVADPFVRETLQLYQRYWWRALRQPASRQALESELWRGLAALLGEPVPSQDEAAIDAFQKRLAEALTQRGYRNQIGRTPPLQDLLVWTRQTSRDYRVDLPDGTVQPVRVELLDGFVSDGWGRYANCERRGTGGWVGTDALYAVSARYDLNSDEFRVNFLGHESQHFADLAADPEMASWKLEYRAKLVELALGRDTREKTLARFYEGRGDDPDAPHAYANRRVIDDVAAHLNGAAPPDLRQVEPDLLRRAAREVLLADPRGVAPRRTLAAPTPAR